MSSPLLLLFAVCLGSGAIGLMVQHAQLRRARRTLVAERLTHELSKPLAFTQGTTRRGHNHLARLLARQMTAAGIQPTWWHPIAGSICCGMAAALGGGFAGGVGAALGLCGSVAAFFAWTSWLAARRRAQILEQLPAFLDHLMRAVDSGASMQQGLSIATNESSDPLAGVFERVNRAVQLGASLEDAMGLVESLDVRELGMIALTVRVNQRFGGSVRDLLQNVVETVRLRDRSRRELRALTGETRLSAWVLGVLPIGIAFYIASVNPEYLDKMFSDTTGRLLLYGAGGLQLLGCGLLWRMVRSV